VSRLPNAANAGVDDAKARDYLLNPGNVQNRGKAGQFAQYGFTRHGWQELAQALRAHALMNQVVQTVSSAHGMKYVVQCNLPTPDGRNPCLRSVWIIDIGEQRPRLVTAY
jgi:hypothetical protein